MKFIYVMKQYILLGDIMITFNEIYALMRSMGMFDFFFPWLLFTALFYGILHSRKTISEQTSINGTIAISLSFLITYFGRGLFMANLFWIASIIILCLFLGLLIGSLFGVNFGDLFKDKSLWVYVGLGIGFVSLILALIVTNSFGYFGLDRIPYGALGDVLGIVAIIAAFVGMFLFIAK